MWQTTSHRRALGLAIVAALGFAEACGKSSHGDDDDDGGSGAESGDANARGGSATAGVGNGGKGGANAAQGGAPNGGSAGTGTGTGAGASAAAGNGASGSGGESGSENGGESAQGGTTSIGGSSGSSGMGGSSMLGGCYAPRWLSTEALPRVASNPLAVTNGLGVFMVTWFTTDYVDTISTFGNTVVSMERDGLYANPLENTLGEGTNPHVDQLAMGKTGDAVWLQDPGNTAWNDTVLRRWDQAAMTWDAPHTVAGMHSFGMRATFLDDHDILVAGTIDDEMTALVYDHESGTWSDPVTIGSLGTALPGLLTTHVSIAADGARNAAVVWSNGKDSGARVMRAGQWVGSAVSLDDDPMIQGFWDVGVVASGDGSFEVIAGPQDDMRGMILKAMTLGYGEGSGTVLGEPVEAGHLPQVVSLNSAQPFTVLRDANGNLTVGSVFWVNTAEYWVFRRVNGSWTPPLLIGSGSIVDNPNLGRAVRAIGLDSGGNALAVTANSNDEIVLREAKNGSSTWTDGIRIDTTDFRFNRGGVSLVMDGDEPVIFFSAEDPIGTNQDIAWTACHE